MISQAMSNRRSLFFIVLLALALRVGYAWNYGHTHSPQALSAIPFLFEPGNIAAALADGKGFSSPLRVESGPTAWMTPIYPLLLAAVFHVFGKYTFHAWQAAVTLNILFGTLTCLPIFALGRRIGGFSVAAIGATLWAIFPNALILPVESMWDASLAALLGACIVLCTLRVAEFKGMRGWIGYGLLWGAALMTSATLGLGLPFLLGWMAWRSRAFAGCAVAAAMILLSCVPWTVRNFVVFHSFVPLRSVGGLSLWMGTIDPDLGKWPASLHPLANSSERARFLELGEIAYSRDRGAAAAAFIEEHPGTEARLIAQRFAGTWSGGALHPWDAFTHSRSAWFRVVLLFNLTLALAALAGILLLVQRRNPNWFPLAALPVVIPFGFYLTLASARYRLLIDPEVIALAAVFFAALFPQNRQQRLPKRRMD